MAFEEAKFALEAATGGKNTLILDDTGMPSVMVRIPAFRWSDVLDGGSDEICSAFIVDGKVLKCIYISKFINIIENGRAYSLPARDPTCIITIDEARAACVAKGRGWHLMTNAEWCAIAHWSTKNGTLSGRNDSGGYYARRRHEHAVTTHVTPPLHGMQGMWNLVSKEGEGGDYPGDPPIGRTLTGTGPARWTHDGTDSGIHDFAGNVWEWVSGIRLNEGELQITKDNDSALNLDESSNSPAWRGIDTSGRLVAPGTEGTYKYDGVKAGSDEETPSVVDGGVKLSTKVTKLQYTGSIQGDARDFGFVHMPFNEMGCEEGVVPHPILRQLGMYPVSREQEPSNCFVRNYGERIASRGSGWYDEGCGGIWSLHIRDNKDYCYSDIGFRAAYIDV